jgi:rubrerythrin
MPGPDPRAALVRLLQLAYSGERAAAFAYQGHATSVRDPAVAEHIRKIESEEWHHRDLVGGMLTTLGAAPDPRRERRANRIGKVLSALCRVSGYLLPMYGAGALESRNVKEYDDAAAFAIAGGHPEFLDGLRAMADVEAEHERFFRERVEEHWLGRHVPMWKPPVRAVGSPGPALERSVP